MHLALNAEIAGKIRDLSEQRGEPLARLIEVTSIPERTFRRRMQGKTAWTTDELAEVAKHFEVKVSALIPR